MQLKDVLAELQNCDVACLCDANKQLQVLDAAIRPQNGGRRFCGVARTVSCRGDFLAVIKALSESRAGEVLVIDAAGKELAVAGELFATEAHRRGLAAIIIDGACRDSEALQLIDLPVWARWTTPMAGSTALAGATQVVVMCGGVGVEPGDIVFGDRDGVAVGKLAQFAAALPRARDIQKTEARVMAAMQAGRSLIDMLNVEEHHRKVVAGTPSRLQWVLGDD